MEAVGQDVDEDSVVAYDEVELNGVEDTDDADQDHEDNCVFCNRLAQNCYMDCFPCCVVWDGSDVYVGGVVVVAAAVVKIAALTKKLSLKLLYVKYPILRHPIYLY